MRLPTRVRKRDCREESFDQVRLVASLRGALGGVNADISLASDLADNVHNSLLGDGTVETSLIAAVVETILARSEWPSASKKYREFRQNQAQYLQRVRVHTAHGRDDVARPWERKRLALAIMRDRHLEVALAWQVARRVERRIVGTDLFHLTGRLVSALADNECRTLGLRADSLEAERVGLERKHLSAFLGGDCLPSADGGPALSSPGRDPRAVLGGQLMARYALQDLLSGSQADAIIDGRYELPSLGDWTRPASILLRPVASESEEAFWRRVCSELGRAHEVQVHWPASRSWSERAKRLPNWIKRPDCTMRLFTDDPELAREWVIDGKYVHLKLSGFLCASQQLRGMLAENGRCLIYWSPEKNLLRRARGFETVYGSAVINLAAPARAASNVGDFIERLGEASDGACAAIKLLSERAGIAGELATSLLPAGLPHALGCLLGPASSEDSATRLLLNIRKRLSQSAERANLTINHYSPPHPESAGSHLALRDNFVEYDVYSVGWNPADASPVPPEAAFRSVPWLQFSAAAALHHEGLERWTETPATH